jgi:hypothetical protein
VALSTVTPALPRAQQLDPAEIIREVTFVVLDCGAILAIFASQVWSQIQRKETPHFSANRLADLK